jgi:predicted MPP superfamily phosphohydrolase
MTRPRRTWRRVQQVLTAGHWPARVAHALGAQGDVRPTRQRFTVQGASAHQPSLHLAFAADFHAGPFTHPRVLDSACTELARLDAPVLLLGGDFVCVSSRDIRELAPRLADIPAPQGKFAVLGNHDYGTGARRVVRALEAAGIRVLVNESVRLPAPWDDTWICGMDDPIAGHPHPERTFADAGGRRVLLMHAPSGLGVIGHERFDLALCGHTHGGQIALPGQRPLFIPDAPEFRRFAYGRYRLSGDRRLFVTRGVGYSTAPIRTFCRSEVVGAELAFHLHHGS